jgi:UPF0271 protein
MPSIDLNADLGEGLGRWRAGDDDALLDLISSASVACGFHAGDPSIMRRTCRAALERGVRIGAHVGYPDLAGFGRREMALSAQEIHDAVVVQVGALAASAHSVGATLAYIKPHGALYHRAARDGEAAEAVVAAVGAVDGRLLLLGPAHSALASAAAASGTALVAEGFADRRYDAEGRLSTREAPRSVLTGEQAADQAVDLARAGRVRSICVHGDCPDAVRTAKAVRAALRDAGVDIAPFA